MRAGFALSLCAALCVPAAGAEIAPPALQRPAAEPVSFAYFQERLAPFGRWLRHPVWGDVWQPDAGHDFRPYFYGYWQYTADYGWLWVSNEPYGEIVYHYGRWVYDPNFGWLWVPGYIWGPSWVAWRETDGYIGWLPMPPGYQDFSYETVPSSAAPTNWYGYQNFYGSNFPLDAFLGLWVFAPNQDFGRSDRRHYLIDKEHLRDLYRRSHDRTRYVHDRERDRIVDRSIDKDALEKTTHESFGAQDGARFISRSAPPGSVSQGQDLARRDREANRWRRPVTTGPSGPAQIMPPGTGAGQDIPAPGRDPYNGNLRGFAGRNPFFHRVPDQANLPLGGVPDAAAAPSGEVIERSRAAPRRLLAPGDPAATLGVGRIVPPTDVLHGMQNAGIPGALPQGIPQAALPAPATPGSVFGRMRGFTPHESSAVAAPSVTPPVAPNATHVAVPAAQPGLGLQSVPAPQAPLAPTAAPPLAPAPLGVSPPSGPGAQSSGGRRFRLP